MSLPTARPIGADGFDPGRLSPSSRRITGVAAILGPLLLLASTLGFLLHGDGINKGVVGGTIGVWSCLALVIALPGILRCVEPQAPKAAPRLSAAAMIGFAGGVSFNVAAIFTGMFGDQIDEFMETAEGVDAVSILAFLPWGWMVPISLVGTGVLLRRLGVGPATTPWLLIVSGVLFISARPARVGPLAVLGDVALFVALVPLALALLGDRDEVPTTETTQTTQAPLERTT